MGSCFTLQTSLLGASLIPVLPLPIFNFKNAGYMVVALFLYLNNTVVAHGDVVLPLIQN